MLRRAFTLIELLVVIAIMGILAVLIIVALGQSQLKAKDAKSKGNARAIHTALAQYYIDNQKYPPQSADGGVAIETIQNDLVPNYIKGTAFFVHNKTAKYITTQSGDTYAQAWEMENANETTVTSGNGVYATNSSGVAGTVTANGTISSAIQFDGVNDYVALSSGFSNFTSGLSVSFWLYPTSTASWQRVIDIANGMANNNILVMRRANSQDLAFEVYVGAVSQGMIYAANSLTQGTWQHFVVTLDASRNVSIYKNGVALALNGGASTTATITAMPSNIARTSNFIGRSNWAGDSYYQGAIDDLRMYNAGLSSTDVTALYNAGVGTYGAATETNLFAGWRFDEGTGTTATDYKGGLVGTLTNSPVWAKGKAPLGLTSIGSSLTGRAFVTYGPQ